MFLKYFAAACACAALVAGCGKKQAAVTITVGAPQTYADDALHFSLQYPGNWPKAVEPGTRVIFYSSTESQRRVGYPFNEGEVGARIEAGAARGDSTAMAQAIAQFKSDYNVAAFQPDSPATLGGAPAVKLTYALETDAGTLHARRTYARTDSFYTYLECAWFDETETAAQPAFAQAVSSLKLAHAVSAAAAAAAAQQASPNLEKFENEFFTVQFPDNFSAHNGKNPGKLASASFHGDRLDCTIDIDVFDAKKLTVDKVFDQNKGKFPHPGSSGETQLNGNPARYLNYSIVNNVASRVYFTVKNDKAFQIVMNWYKPLEQNYLPVFEKCIASLRIK